MVSTRGGARTGADENTHTRPNTMPKKPVRKATTATGKAPAKSKLTRSKKLEILPAGDAEQPEESAEDPVLPATRPARQPTIRGKKVESGANEDVAGAIGPSEAPSKTTRAASMRKGKASTSEEAPTLQPLAPSRATRATRATAAKDKAQPLSPKKITQVSRGLARRDKFETGKEKGVKAAPAKSEPKERARARKRTVSDENAEIPNLAVDTADDDEIFVAPRKPTKLTASDNNSMEAPKSAKSYERRDMTLAHPDMLTTQEHDSEDELAVLRDDWSDADTGDELCGPKTPMKRCSPREGRLYRSPSKQPLDAEEGATHVRPRPAFGSQLKTPQTQKLYRKPAVSIGSTGPMSVSRAHGRAMVFRRLEAMDEAKETDQSISEVTEPQQVESGQASIQVSMPNAPTGEHDTTLDDMSSSDLSSFESSRHNTLPDDLKVMSAPEDSESELSDQDETMVDDPTLSHLTDDAMHNGIGPDFVSEEDLENGGNLESSSLSDIADIVDVTQAPEDELESEDDSETSLNDTDMFQPTPVPQTVVWGNIQHDVVIPIDFDTHLDMARTLPEVDQTERLSIIPGLIPMNREDEQATEGATPDHDSIRFDRQPHAISSNSTSRHSIGGVRRSLDDTVNLSDFIDVDSLVEATEIIHTPFANAITRSVRLNDELDIYLEKSEDVLESPAIRQTPSTRFLALQSTPRVSQEQLYLIERPAPVTPRRQDVDVDSVATSERRLPHYTLPTIASASRRKSLPGFDLQRTPVQIQSRPHTSDGHSMPRIRNPFAFLNQNADRINEQATPLRRRPSTAHGTTSTAKRTTSYGKVVPPTVTSYGVGSSSKNRFSGSPLRTSNQAAESVSFTNPEGKQRASELKRPISSRHAVSTPRTAPKERFSGLPSRRTYEEHAKTVIATSRFRTPSHISATRPATVQKPATLRKLALRASTPTMSQTPVKTPLKAQALTPAQAPMTPHPAAPLRGVVAFVEIFTNDGAPASAAFVALLQRLGAKTTKSWSERITHVVWKEGSPTTLQKVRMHNKTVTEAGTGTPIHCVNSRWISDCDAEGKRMDENEEAFMVDIEDAGRASKRRRKSMEPSTLMNIGGNVMRDRKSSLGRNSLGRASMKWRSPDEAAPARSQASFAGKENGTDEEQQSSPATPAYLAAPDSLIQQTAPMKRVRKLDLHARDAAKSRRLTCWNGAA